MLVLVIGDLHLPNRASDLPNKFRKLLVPGKIQQIICTGNVCDRETLDYLRTIAGDVHVVRGDWDENPHFPNSIILHHPPLRIGVLHGHQIVPPGDSDSLCSIARAMDVDLLVTGHTHRFDAFEREDRFFVNPGSATGAWSSVWPVREGEEKDEIEEEKEGEGKEITSESVKKEGKQDETPKQQSGAEVSETAKVEGEQEEEGEGKEKKKKEDLSKEEKIESDTKAPTNSDPKPAPDPTPSFALLDVQGPVVVTYVYQLIDGEVKVEKMEFRKKLDNANPPNGNPRRVMGTART